MSTINFQPNSEGFVYQQKNSNLLNQLHANSSLFKYPHEKGIVPLISSKQFQQIDLNQTPSTQSFCQRAFYELAMAKNMKAIDQLLENKTFKEMPKDQYNQVITSLFLISSGCYESLGSFEGSKFTVDLSEKQINEEKEVIHFMIHKLGKANDLSQSLNRLQQLPNNMFNQALTELSRKVWAFCYYLDVKNMLLDSDAHEPIEHPPENPVKDLSYSLNQIIENLV